MKDRIPLKHHEKRIASALNCCWKIVSLLENSLQKQKRLKIILKHGLKQKQTHLQTAFAQGLM